jgi:DNA-binding PadR family transcriptional regulator
MRSEPDLDLGHVETDDQLHDLLARCLVFPAFYGRNGDAFWDCMGRVRGFSDVDGYNVMRYIRTVPPLSPADPSDLLPLPVAMFHILVAVADQDRHGYAIMQDVAARTNGALKLSPGTLYGSIRRMLDEALIVELSDRQRPDEDDERRRYYRITAFGRSVAQAEAARLTTLLRQAKAVGLTPSRA